ncbi:MAG: 2,3-bisphosphoglycerate-independent phosphoglycerate mutase [Candidatus Hydrothermales bacterium]
MEEVVKEIISKNNKKILLFVIDGLSGLPLNGKTEMEVANKPNLDELAKRSTCGRILPCEWGITPGSGPAHLSLFGYDPFRYQIGRGVLEALGVGADLKKGDIAIRCNFCKIDENGIVVDRRAGRIETEESRKLVEKLKGEIKKIDDVEIILYPGKEHRFVLILRGEELSPELKDTDPLKEGKKPFDLVAKDKKTEKTKKVVEDFLKKAAKVLKDEKKANYVLLRGFSSLPEWETFEEKWKLKACGIAYYPMYKGLAKLVGMDVVENVNDFEEACNLLPEVFKNYDFIYLHYKETDKKGEDGDFYGKVKEIENVDKYIPFIIKSGADVIAITADHSTPAVLKSHSWHPTPLLIYSPIIEPDNCEKFDEREVLKGYLGIIKGNKLLPLLLALSGKLEKFGA